MEDEPPREQTLGRVTEDLDGPRGPDVSFEISVPEAWISAGVGLVIAWPRRAICRSCSGGGCDTCGRSGAFLLAKGPGDDPLEVTLPALESPPALLTIRLPGSGIPSSDASLPAGHLFLDVRSAERASPGVARASVPQAERLRPGLVRTSLFVALGLSLLFLCLLRLSGWL